MMTVIIYSLNIYHEYYYIPVRVYSAILQFIIIYYTYMCIAISRGIPVLIKVHC